MSPTEIRQPMPASALAAVALALFLQQASRPANDPTTTTTPSGSMPLRVDATGRMEAAVTLDGKGPFAFTVDTAATGTMLSQALADRLRFRTGGAKQIVGGIGRAESQSVTIDTFHTPLFDRHNESMPLLPRLYADGILGMAPFMQGRIELDIEGHVLKAGPSGPAPDGFATLAGELRHGILIVDVRIDGVPAKALVDTGAPYDIGNPKLQAALGFVPGDARLSNGGTFYDSFGQERLVEQATPDRIAIGAVGFSQPTLRFADMPVFRALGLDDGPALILGIEQLSHMGAIAIDFPRAELQLRP